MDTVGSLHFFVCGHLGIYGFLLKGLSLRFQLAEISSVRIKHLRSSFGFDFFSYFLNPSPYIMTEPCIGVGKQ